MRIWTRSTLASLSLSALVLTGCAAEQLPPVDEVLEVVEEVVEAEVPRHPLTGMELGTASLPGPSMAVKIDNTSSGRPQVGIAAADLAFEELVEGGFTRFLAVFESTIPAEVGPVRSGRPQDAGLVKALGGVFVFSGVGNANVREIIRGTGLQLVEHDTSGGTPDGVFFVRSDRKPAPWNLHIKAADLMATYSTLDAPVQQFDYKTDPAEASAVVSGSAAERITVLFSKGIESIWEWDVATNSYLKFLSDGSPHTDADGTQISASNVVILTPNYADVEGLPSAQISGTIETAYVATGGKIVSGNFDATAYGEPIALIDGDGNPLYLTPGKTFVLLPPGGGSTAGGVTPGVMTYLSGGEAISRNF